MGFDPAFRSRHHKRSRLRRAFTWPARCRHRRSRFDETFVMGPAAAAARCGEPARMVANVRRPGGRLPIEAFALTGKQGSGRFFETRSIARHRAHEAIGRLLRSPDAILVIADAPRLIDQLAQRDGGAAGLAVEPVPVPRQQRDLACNDPEPGAAGAARCRLGGSAAGLAGRPSAAPTAAARHRPACRENPVRWSGWCRRRTAGPRRRGRWPPSPAAPPAASSPDAMRRAPSNAVQWICGEMVMLASSDAIIYIRVKLIESISSG